MFILKLAGYLIFLKGYIIFSHEYLLSTTEDVDKQCVRPQDNGCLRAVLTGKDDTLNTSNKNISPYHSSKNTGYTPRMIFVYNFLQLILLLVTFPFLLMLVLIKQKYRGRIGQRLGFGLQQKIDGGRLQGRSRIWLHCLSVGEVTSAIPLLRGIRRQLPDAFIVFTVATSTGMKVAEIQAGPHTDLVLAAPLDLRPTIRTFIRYIDPDLFILVETDFWPNWLDCLRQQKIPAMLVNGRISLNSFRKYRRLQFFFSPMFNSFSLLAMQTANDGDQVRKLGAGRDRIAVLGNLKYDTASVEEHGSPLTRAELSLPEDAIVWLCGSTHAGEEEILLAAFARLRTENQHLAMVLAPRDPGRRREIFRLAEDMALQPMLRTQPGAHTTSLLILDTIGELAGCYRLGRVAFIGGSLVACGGHNPLEAAAQRVPVLFGPHMEDFQEIARDLVQCGGALCIRNADDAAAAVRSIINDNSLHQTMSQAAGGLIARNTGVVNRHVEKVVALLQITAA